MDTKFKNTYGEWALITGASSGIGRALAYEIAERGLDVILVGRRQPELNAVADDIKRKYPVSTTVLVTDLANETDLGLIASKTDHLNVGFLVLSAGLENNGSFTKTDLTKEIELVQLNIISTLTLSHHFIKKMEQRKKGGILFVSSLTAHMPSPYFSNYAATKSYILSLGTSLYGELKSKGIDVSVLSPGVTNTPMSENTGVNWKKTPVKTMEPKEVAKEAMLYFGKKLSIIPGSGNKVFAFLAKKFLSDSKLAISNQKMMQQVLNPIKL